MAFGRPGAGAPVRTKSGRLRSTVVGNTEIRYLFGNTEIGYFFGNTEIRSFLKFFFDALASLDLSVSQSAILFLLSTLHYIYECFQVIFLDNVLIPMPWLIIAQWKPFDSSTGPFFLGSREILGGVISILP